MSKEAADEELSNINDHLTLSTKINEMESTEESSLLNSIVEAVMRGDMNQVVTLALSHKSSDQKVKNMVDQALSSAISNRARLNEEQESENITDDTDIYSHNITKSVESITMGESLVTKSPNSNNHQCTDNSLTSQNVIYSQRTVVKSKENNEFPCTYYFSNEPIISSICTNVDPNSNTSIYCQSGYTTQNTDIDNQPDDSLNSNLAQFQVTNSNLHNVETINTLNVPQQSVQVQLPGIGNFLLQIPSNFKPGEPITLPLNLPLTPVSQTSGVNPISIHMNTGQIMSNQLLSLYNPSSNINITAGKKMRAIAPKPSKPTYRQPLIAPKNSSPNTSTINQDSLNINSAPLPAPSGPGRRKGNKGKKSGRKRGAPAKSHKNSSYASSTHSMDSQDASQFNELTNTMKQNCNNSMSTCSTYQCNYYVNNDSSDYLNQSHVTISQSFQEINSNTLMDNSDSGEKDLLSLAWEISNAELGNTDDFASAYNLYDTNNLEADGFVSSEILDQFLQNIQKDDITELARCSSTQINMDSRVSYTSSFATLPPCSTVLPSVTTTYLNKYSNNSSNVELPQCIEIAEVVNLNTEDMLSELEKEENALLDKFVAQYGTNNQSDNHSQTVIPVSSDSNELIKINDNNIKEIDSNCRVDVSHEDSEKELDMNTKESNELSEIAKQIEISCSSIHQNNDRALKSKIYAICENVDTSSKADCYSKIIENTIPENDLRSNLNNTISFCAIPNTSLELIYSSTDTSLIDEKTQCLMSLNFNSKRSSESSFYITDSSLKSKTLDDFGLFEFCTDGEISLNVKTLNPDSTNIIVDDDNKYIEPPILEDISDATPIQSENESEDEDIDELAFKFSRFDYKISDLNKAPNYQSIDTHRLFYNHFIKDFPSLDNFKATNFCSKNSREWYQGMNEIEIADVFLAKTDLMCKEKSLLNEPMCKESELEKHPSEYKCLNELNTTSNSNTIDIEEDSCNTNENKVLCIPSSFGWNLTAGTNNENPGSTEKQPELIEIQTDHHISHENLDSDIEIIDEDCLIIKSTIEDELHLHEDSMTSNNKLKNIAVKMYKSKVDKFDKTKQRKVVSKNYNKSLGTLNKSQINDESTKNLNVKLLSNTSATQGRQRRLRKPPKKLAIYQSINFIEKEFSQQDNTKLKLQKKIEITKNQGFSTDFKRCTRSKGTISKSFDSFYEAISRHHKISSKNKVSPKDAFSNTNSFVNICEEYQNDVNEDLTDKPDLNLTINDKAGKPESHLLTSNSGKAEKTAARLSSVNITSTSNNCLNLLKRGYKNSNIIKKYNLRKKANVIEHKNDQVKSEKSKILKTKFKTDKNIFQSMDNGFKIKSNISRYKKRGNISLNVKTTMHNAVILDHHYEYEIIDFHLNFVSFQSLIIEGAMDDVQYPFTNIKPTLKANIVENKCYMESSDFEINIKKNYPVRKINKKLRMFSGLEIPINDKNVKYASLVDMNLNEIPCRFQCCSQFAKVTSNLETCKLKCNVFAPEYLFSVIKTQNFASFDDLSVSDNDDVESLDAPLVIVEIEDISDLPSHEKSSIKGKNGLDNTTNNQDISRFDNQSVTNTDESCITKLNLSEIPKSYPSRSKSRQSISFRNSKKNNKDFISHKIRRPLFNRACKVTEYNQNSSISETDDNSDLIKRINLKTPVCSIEKLSHNEIIANLCISSSPTIENEVFNVFDSSLNLHEKTNKNIDKNTVNINEPVIKNYNIKIFKKLRAKLFERIKTRNKFNIYKSLKRSIWRKTLSRIFNYKSKSKRKIISKYSQDYSDNLSSIDNNVKLIEEGIAQIIIQSKTYNEDICDNYDNISINVDNDSPNHQFNSYLDSNNVETFSRNYGSFSLKIKVQKQDPSIIEKPIEISKKHKKNSKKRKKLRHFLSSIIGPEDTIFNKYNCSEDFNVTCNNTVEPDTDKKRKNRKRKYTINRDDVYCLRNNGNNNQRPPQLTPESIINEELQYQKPIKIKLFKSTSEELMKSDGSSFHSEKVVFSLQKSESSEKKEINKTSNQKVVQIAQELSSKPCRQAANLAKKKIFSTAKEDRRSQNATLTSIWNSKKSNNGNVKTSSDILTIYQSDRGKRPRGRPPKLNQSLFISEKQASSTGTLKLKIKLSKDFKNCNNDSHSSNGENSGRTSTNDSSILNSAVAGINGPSDALSLESNNFINGITEQLDQNIEYLEAKEAKVYFDPNQVDIERIKNSYYSSKKTNSESFSFESQQRLYEDSISDICSKKSDIVSGNRNFSQYNDLDTIESNNMYNNILSKENLNSKISHLPKENISITDNCYKNVANREPQNQSQTNQSFQFENQLPSSGKNPPDLWQNSKINSTTALTSCRNNSSWFSDPRTMRDPSFQNSNSILYNSYITSTSKENKSCISQNPPFVICENETTDSKLPQRSPSKRSSSSEGRKSGSNSFSLNESHNQLSPHYVRGGIGSVPTQLNIHPWSDEPNHNTSLNHTAAAWMTYAQQQAAAAYMDPQMKAYYNLALSQSMLNNPYCGSYGNPAANSENFYSSLHSQCLNNSKDANEKISIANGGVRSHSDPMGSFMEAAQMSSWEHFYSAAAMAGYHNSSHATMDDYAGRAGNMLQAHHMLANGYPGSMLGRDHFSLDSNKPPLAHQNQSGTTSPIKLTGSGSTPVSSSQAYSHVQMPYSHFSGTTVGFF